MIRNYLQFYPQSQRWMEKWPYLEEPLCKLGMPSMSHTCDGVVTFTWKYTDRFVGSERHREVYYLRAGQDPCKYEWFSMLRNPTLGTLQCVDTSICDESDWLVRALMSRGLYTKEPPSKFTLFSVIGAL